MAKGRGYAVEMREKHIKRKKKICEENYHWSYYPQDGYYSKNKIHCSCPLCSAKTRNKGKRKNYSPSINYKHSEQQRINCMDYNLNNFED
jgi:hypothetical protein